MRGSLAWSAAVLVSAVLVAACGSAGTSPAAVPSPATSGPPVAASKPPSSPANSTPAPSPALAVGADCPETASPSSIADMEPQARIACYESGEVVFDADVLVASGAIVDQVAMDVPAVYRSVRRPSPDWPDRAAEWPVFLVDEGGTDVASGAVDLRVADPSVVPPDLPARLHARITGHFDDPAASECHPPPAGFMGGEMTPEQAVLMCRGSLVVTRIEPEAP